MKRLLQPAAHAASTPTLFIATTCLDGNLTAHGTASLVYPKKN
jgi:hypothetical protein